MRTSRASMNLRSAFAALGATAALAFAAPASAQDSVLDTERFKPAVTHDGFVTTEGSAVRSTDDPWAFGLFLNYGRNQLVVVDGTGKVTRQLESGRLGGDLMASFTIFKPFTIGLGLPVFLAQTGDPSPSFAGLGDLRLVPKFRILDDRESIGLALVAEVRFPTHVGDFSGGARSVVFQPKVVVDHRFANGIRVGANVGVTLREQTTYGNITAGHEFSYSAAAGYRFGGTTGKTELGLEALGGVGLATAQKEETPLEGLLYLKHNPSEEWELTGGPGMGLVPGYGVPTFRVFAGVRFTPTSHDRDHDGVSDSEDKCPDEAEDRDHINDTDGCPEDDDDSDGIPDAEDKCPNQKEFINGFQDEDGCPDEGPARVVVEEGRIQILETVRFKTGSSEIDPESHSILNQVALTMKANKQIKRVRVEGHTDETGSRDMNIQLSKSRAASVREYLISRGVKPERLSSEGYGPDRPAVQGTDDAARAQNRRVEFIVQQ
jgi:OOP family OmpA-OmpF porin